MRRLVDEHAAAFGVPASAPRVGLVIRRVAPAIHREHAEHRTADLAGVDGGLHALHRLVPAPLADDAEFGSAGRAAASIASQSAQAGRQRFFDQHVHARTGGLDRRLGVQRVRRGDAQGLDVTLASIRARSLYGFTPKRAANDVARSQVDVARGYEFGFGQRGQRLRVNLADLAAANSAVRTRSIGDPQSGKYCRLIRRKNASDSAISSIPFMPSSMLTQPWYRCSARMRKMAS